jgi:hypothetical protein
MIKAKLSKLGIEYTVNENMDEMRALGIKGIPSIQLADGTILDYAASIKYVKELEKKQ